MQIVDRTIDPLALQRLLDARLPAPLARLYASRGVAEATELDYALARLPSYTLLTGAREAGERLADAVVRGERMLVIGDYDADGATATAVAVRGLRSMGGVVDFLVPNRFEYGYGLTPEIVELAAEQKPDLLITVDNGIASVDGVARANELGMPVLVTDHHLPGAALPAAAVIVNPNQPGCDFPSKALAGVGVMFYVLLATRAVLRERGVFDHRPQPNLAQWLDLVALGTVADVVRLDPVNRALVHQGLARLRAGELCAGLKAMYQVAGRDPREASCYDLGFVLGPRLNAAGRLEDMSIGIQCLLADDADLALNLAETLDELNRARREIEADMQAEALAALSVKPVEGQYSLTLFDAAWHQGVVGLVASRLKDRFHRPTIVFARGDDGLLKGSGRSIPGFHLRDALDLVAKRLPDSIAKFGGHAMAAGLTLNPDAFDTFAETFEQVCREWLPPELLTRTVETDGELAPQEVELGLAEALERSVWGQAFPPPLFRGCFMVREQRVIGERHLRLSLQAPTGGPVLEAIAFNQPDFLPDRVDTVYRLGINRYGGRSRVQLVVQHWQSAEMLQE